MKFAQLSEININKKKYSLFKNMGLFLLFSFTNCITPIVLCVLTSFLPLYGAQAVMGIGYASTFLLSFAQLGSSFAISLYYLFRKKTSLSSKNQDFVRCIFLSLIAGLICMFIYIISNYLYFTYSNNRPNTIDTLEYGLNFVYSSIGFILLSSLESFLLIYLSNKSKTLSILLFLLRFILSICFGFIILYFSELNTIGIGLSLSIVTFIFIIIDYFIVKHIYNFKIIKHIKSFYKVKNIFKPIIQESISVLALSLSKGICILILGFIMYEKLTDFVSLSYQMSRVVWFNIMYMIPWFGIAISDTIKFNELYKRTITNQTLLKQQFTILILISIIVAIIFSIIGYFLVKPLIFLYIKNTHLLNGCVPELGDNLSLKTLPPTYLPEIKPNQSLKQYLITTLINDPEWNKWLKENSLDILGNLRHFNLFKNWFLNYISSTVYDKDIIYALLMYKTPEELSIINSPLLFKFQSEGFNSKTFFYIVIYGSLSSGWSVMLPAIATISKKQMKPWLLALIYFLIVGSIISFGAIFSITNIAVLLGNNNPFMYLDAWTFPIALTAIIVFIYLLIKWVYVCIKYGKKNKNIKQEKIMLKR